MNFIFLGQSYYAKIYDTTETLNASSDSNFLIANFQLIWNHDLRTENPEGQTEIEVVLRSTCTYL
jgi:hypothetical protein